jgi:ATP-binding cassette subfamily C (CFTR/MRP) protein 1
LVATISVATILNGFVQIASDPQSWFGDFRFWTTVLQTMALVTIFALHELEHERSRVTSGVLLFYWLFHIFASIMKVWSLYTRRTNQSLIALGGTSLILAVLVLALELFVPKKQSMYRAIGDDKECPSEYSNIFSLLSFEWLTPLMNRGYKTYLTEDDLWDLPTRNTSKSNGDRFAAEWTAQTKKLNPRVWKAIFASYGRRYLGFVPLKICADALSYVQPQLLRLLVDFVESYTTARPYPPIRGFLIAIAMFAVSLVQSVCNLQFMNLITEMGFNLRSGLVANIYRKSLRLSNEGRASKTTGDIVNLMAVDTQRIGDLSRQGHQLWSSPFQIVLCIVSLNQLLGWAGLAGVAVMCFMIPLNIFIARLMKEFQKVQMRNKDTRTGVTTEILMNIKSIKLYSWTSAFASKLAQIRNQELKTLRKIGATQAASRFCWNSTPFLVSCATFALYVLINKTPLSVDLVFPALTLFNLLTNPLTQLPNVITSVVESTVAMGRIRSFLMAGEIQDDAVQFLPAAKDPGEEAIRVREASFSWEANLGTRVLSNISFSACKGELSCIVGRVGSGKSSLLHAMLGDLHKLDGEVVVRGTVAYVPQNAWIMNASVKDNILFGHRYDPDFYQKTIRACALAEDLAILPDGDRTEVGEKGISLSGGQKARLQLARAVYARADVYLFDDILSAVDQHVGRHIINQVIGSNGLLRGRTRVLATNSIPVLQEASHIVLVNNGSITEQGSYLDAVMRDGGIATLIRTVKTSSAKSDSPISSTSSSPTKLVSSMNADIESDEDSIHSFDEKEIIIDEPGRASLSSLRRDSSSSFGRGQKGDEETALAPISRQTKEISAKGKVKWSIYTAYARACDIRAVCLWIFIVLLVQSLQVSGSVWVKHWAEQNEKTGSNMSIAKNVGVYFGLGIVASAMVVVQTMIMWIFCSIRASKTLHERMAHAMFRSPMSFFETTPVGRILNRFSTDVFRVDEAIGRSFSDLFGCLARVSFTLGVICVTTPLFIAVLIPLSALYLYIQRYYLRSNRELKRLESVSKSPIYAHFSESLGGVSTIRAFKQQQRWIWENENRVDSNMKALFPSMYANRWLGIRLEFMGALIVSLSALLSILALINGLGPSAGMVGLAMSYALQITQYLNWTVQLSVEVETNIVSVERVLEYAQLPSEAEDIVYGNRPTKSWPEQGAVVFNDYSMRYRPNLDLVLKNICLNFKPHEKIGVVGRTGAGKSSLTLSLFRIIEAALGWIEIDNVNTSSIGLEDLRSKLAIIPQDAALFEGTIRDNLDPAHKKKDNELWAALGK